MALVNPIRAYSLSVKDWIKNIFIHNPSPLSSGYSLLSESATVGKSAEKTQWGPIFRHDLDSVFLETYGFDGYDEASTQVTTATGQVSHGTQELPIYGANNLPIGLALLSFFGLPNRAKYVDNNDGVPLLPPRQFVRNLIGGWNSKVSREKMIWQKIAAVTVKPFLIVPLKILTMLLKTVVNTVKLFTEFLPSLLWKFSGEGLGLLEHRMLKVWNVPRKAAKNSSSPTDLKPMSLGRKGLFLFLYGLSFFILGLVHISSRLFSLVGRVLTSPEKSARLAFAYGRAIDLTGTLGKNAGKAIGIILGVLGLLISIALCATLWAIALPLVLSATSTLIPAALPAITWLSKLPLIATSLGVIKGTVITVGGVLGAAFAPTVAMVAGLAGLKISATALAVGVTSGLVLAPVASGLSWTADRLSNAWASWVDSGPFTALGALLSANSGKHKQRDDSDAHVVPLTPVSSRINKTPSGNTQPSASARQSVSSKDAAITAANKEAAIKLPPDDDSSVDTFGNSGKRTPLKPKSGNAYTGTASPAPRPGSQNDASE